MEIKYVPKSEITGAQQEMLHAIEKTCFGFSSAEIMKNAEEGHPFGAVELGAVLLFNDEKIVGNAYFYKRLTAYDGQEYYIGGFGGLAVLPAYRGKGYARQLAEEALKKAYEIGIDVACLFTSREETIHEFYESLGFAFLSRKGYYIDSLHREASEDDVMIMGLNDKAFAEKILATNHKFHYGQEEGCW